MSIEAASSIFIQLRENVLLKSHLVPIAVNMSNPFWKLVYVWITVPKILNSFSNISNGEILQQNFDEFASLLKNTIAPYISHLLKSLGWICYTEKHEHTTILKEGKSFLHCVRIAACIDDHIEFPPFATFDTL